MHMPTPLEISGGAWKVWGWEGGGEYIKCFLELHTGLLELMETGGLFTPLKLYNNSIINLE